MTVIAPPPWWQALCNKTRLTHLAEDERFDSVRQRAEHHRVIVPQLHEALAQYSALEWEVIFGDDVPCAAARRVDEMFGHSQCQAESLIAEFEHPVAGRYLQLLSQASFS